MKRLQYLSFADPELPKGAQFLGAVIIDAPDFVTAVMLSHMRGLNPGGEVVAVEIAEDVRPPPEYIGRLLTRAEIDAMDREMDAAEATR